MTFDKNKIISMSYNFIKSGVIVGLRKLTLEGIVFIFIHSFSNETVETDLYNFFIVKMDFLEHLSKGSPKAF